MAFLLDHCTNLFNKALKKTLSIFIREISMVCIFKFSFMILFSSLSQNLLRNFTINFSPYLSNRRSFPDRLFYIYTSGTTGPPKAAIIKHHRFIWMGGALRNMLGLHEHETFYTCLPLYHLAGGCLGVCQVLIFANTIAIRHKFSASHFWQDCIKYRCTVSNLFSY